MQYFLTNPPSQAEVQVYAIAIVACAPNPRGIMFPSSPYLVLDAIDGFEEFGSLTCVSLTRAQFFTLLSSTSSDSNLPLLSVSRNSHMPTISNPNSLRTRSSVTNRTCCTFSSTFTLHGCGSWPSSEQQGHNVTTMSLMFHEKRSPLDLIASI